MQFPIDTAALTNVVAVGDPAPDTDREGVHKANRDGEPLYVVQVAATFNGTPSLMKVKVAGAAPKLGALTPVVLVGLVANTWEVGGRHGVSFLAKEIRPAGPVPPAAPKN